MIEYLNETKWLDTLSQYDVAPEIMNEFDWIHTPEDSTFVFGFDGDGTKTWFALEEFTRIPDNDTMRTDTGWEGIYHGTYSSGYLIKFDVDSGMYKISQFILSS